MYNTPQLLNQKVYDTKLIDPNTGNSIHLYNLPIVPPVGQMITISGIPTPFFNCPIINIAYTYISNTKIDIRIY